MAQLVARKYAIALFEIAQEGNLDLLSSEVNVINEALMNEPNFLQTLLNPRITCEQKLDIINTTFKGFSSSILGFLDIVFRKNRENELPEMFAIFNKLHEEHEGILNANVVSATELSEVQKKRIVAELTKKTNKKVRLTVAKDASLIGGLYINAGGYVFDSTVKKQLEDMRLALLN